MILNHSARSVSGREKAGGSSPSRRKCHPRIRLELERRSIRFHCAHATRRSRSLRGTDSRDLPLATFHHAGTPTRSDFLEAPSVAVKDSLFTGEVLPSIQLPTSWAHL
jgi:hypothetical protein